MIDWVAFVPAAVVVSLVPGTNQLLSLRNAIRHGAAPATVALLGRFSAFTLMAIAVSVGLGAVLTRSAIAFEIVRWAGVTYLAYLGLTTLRDAWRSPRRPAQHDREPPRTSFAERARQATRREFVVALTNPKAMLLLAASYIGIEAVSAVGYTLLGGRLGHVDLTARAHRRLDAVTGTSFLGLGGYLAVEQRP